MRPVARPGPPLFRTVTLMILVGCSGGDAAGPDPDAPFFTTSPETETDHNRPWAYSIGVEDPNGDPVTVSVVRSPRWMDFDEAARTLSGTAGWDGLGLHNVLIRASDGTHEEDQTFNLLVVRGEILCDSEFGDPADSPYTLPYRVGGTYRLIQTYCPPNPAWGHHNWFAYDFDTSNGDTILASRAGRVISVQEHNPNVGGVCGQNAENFVFIEHDDRTVMQYVHLFPEGALVSVDEVVERGQPIGISGNSGCSSGPHVHVALFRNRANFDRQSTLPFNYVNTDGPLDERNGLVQSAEYTALDPEGGG